VVNHGEDANDIYKTDNKKTLLFLSTSEYPFTLGVIDAASPGLELSTKKAGVGFARKIGLDLVLPHMTDKKSLLLSTDADTTVASHYLQTILNYFNQYDADAAVMGFCHMPPDNTNLEHAIKEYEEYLRSTAWKIKEAGSPYGYVALGSAMVCTVEAYMAVGGMPQKNATEDFYFLQELTKFCGVHSIPEILVYPSPRPICRVYLGTGFRMTQAQQGFEINSLYYSKNAFTLLKKWIAVGSAAWQMNVVELLDNIESKNKELKSFLVNERIETIWENLQLSSPSEHHFIKQFHRWFDGLKTIRFLKHFSVKDKF